MRVSQNQLYNLLTNHLQDSFSTLAQLQEQVSSGRRIQRPSDDPTGSSLALALHVVEAHNGRIDVVSTPGRGSTFSVRIPLQEQT